MSAARTRAASRKPSRRAFSPASRLSMSRLMSRAGDPPEVSGSARLLDQLGFDALVEDALLHLRVATGAVEVFLQQPARGRRHDFEVAVLVLAAHVRNEQLVARSLLHRWRYETYGNAHTARIRLVGA